MGGTKEAEKARACQEVAGWIGGGKGRVRGLGANAGGRRPRRHSAGVRFIGFSGSPGTADEFQTSKHMNLLVVPRPQPFPSEHVRSR
jgi:hypothetical protein